MSLLSKIGNRILNSLFLSAVLSLSFSVWAEQAGMDDQVIEKTLADMQDPQKIAEMLKNNPQAMELLKGNPEANDPNAMAQIIQQALRKISSDGSGTNLKQVKEVMEEAKRDPQSFFNKLSPEQKQMLKSLGYDESTLDQ